MVVHGVSGTSLYWLFLRVTFEMKLTRKQGQHVPLTWVHAPLSLFSGGEAGVHRVGFTYLASLER